MTLSPSDVVMIPFPYTDLKTSKRRPVLVLWEADVDDAAAHGGDLAGVGWRGSIQVRVHGERP